jgi:glycosyltransferase involved in cell wall biosynthesis
MPLLSLIIPVYNTEKYIRKCLDSIFNQEIDESLLEVIVVNDGTPDGSMAIVGEFLAAHHNMVVINEKNQGSSVARNTAIKAATGDYIWCIDSDDWITDDSINALLPLLCQHKYQVIAMLNYRVCELDKSISQNGFSRYLNGKLELSGSDYLFEEGNPCPSWLFVFNRDFLVKNKLFYIPGILYEDYEFGVRSLYLAHSVYLLRKPTYYYLIRTSGSNSSDVSIKTFNSYSIIATNLQLFEETVVLKCHKRYFRAIMYMVLMDPIFIILRNRDLLSKLPLHQFWKDYRIILYKNFYSLFFAKHVHFRCIYSNIKTFFVLNYRLMQ